jgi:hypothetical protein
MFRLVFAPDQIRHELLAKGFAMRLLSLLFAGAAAASMGCGTDTPCTPGPVTIAVTQPSAFACHVPYTAQFSMTNGSCAPVTISAVDITGAIVDSTPNTTCNPIGDSHYTPAELNTATVGAGKTATFFNLTGGKFCCTGGSCPPTFVCDETFSFSVTTSAGILTAPSLPGQLQLSGCTGEPCPT